MATLSPASSITLPTPQLFQNQSREASADKSYAAFREIFDRVIGYRHGKGYSRVRALLLTWQDDDMHCKETEVSILKDILHNKFHFETDYFEIPSEKCQTSLQKKLSEFYRENDDPDCLSILYYGGHGYIGKDTNQYKLAAKWKADGNGDPSVFFNDIRTSLRQPDCDQLVILDCCFSGSAYSPDRVGKRKFELFTSAAHDAESPAPKFEGSFTRALNQALRKLLEENEGGFLAYDLFCELYHSIPKDRPRPHWFDQSRHDYGKIRLRPHNSTAIAPTQRQNAFFNLTLRMNVEPEDAIIHELARNLSFLPHVDEVRYGKIYEPMKDFFASVTKTQIFNALLKKLPNKPRPQPKTAAVREGFGEVRASDSVKVSEKQMSQNLTLKSTTWPLAQGTICSHTKIVSGTIHAANSQVEVLGTEALASGSLFAGKCKRACSERETAIGASNPFGIDIEPPQARRKRQRTASPN